MVGLQKFVNASRVPNSFVLIRIATRRLPTAQILKNCDKALSLVKYILKYFYAIFRAKIKENVFDDNTLFSFNSYGNLLPDNILTTKNNFYAKQQKPAITKYHC